MKKPTLMLLILFGIILIFNLYIFPTFVISNPDTKALDTMLCYSPEEAYDVLSGFSQNELQRYSISLLTVDILYPLIYGLFFALSISQLFVQKRLLLIPLAVFIFDVLENIGIATLINYYPEKIYCLAKITSTFTSLKWLGICAVLLLIATKFILQLIDRFTTQRR